MFRKSKKISLSRCIPCSAKFKKSIYYKKCIPEYGSEYRYCPSCMDIPEWYMQTEYNNKKFLKMVDAHGR